MALGYLSRAQLIDWYDVNDTEYIQIRDFDAHQAGLHKRTKSKYPECIPGKSRKVADIPSELNRTELNRREEEEREEQIAAAPRVSLSDAQPRAEKTKGSANGHSSPNLDPFTDPLVTERAGRFIDHYAALYPQHRNGARYTVRPTRDYAAAVTLCQTWPDDARLEKLAICFLTTDHKFAMEGSRTIPQFLALASWVDGQLAEWEKNQQVRRASSCPHEPECLDRQSCTLRIINDGRAADGVEPLHR
jgi:hypothetical protein